MKKAFSFFLTVGAVFTLGVSVWAQQQTDHRSTAPPLVQLLQAKGILTAEEAANVSQAGSADEANARLAQLLVAKGVISQQDYNNTVGEAPQGAHLVNAVERTSSGSTGSAFDALQYGAPKEPGIIPAITPPRLLPIDPARDPKGLIPDIKLGSGALLNAYGFVKLTEIYDTSNSGGGTFGNNDFPLPMLLGDTGPDSGSQFHTKARSTRAGVNFFWPKANSDIIFSGKVEFDFEGDYTLVNNRNASSVRNPQPSLRLAWVRMDTKVGDLPVFVEFGQDWTLVSASTFADLVETTQAGAFFGNPYERLPQVKAGVQFHAGDFKVQPEIGVMMGAFGDANLGATPPCVTPPCFVPASSTAEQNQSRFGARVGSDSGLPNVEGRIVFQYPFFRRPGVAPAQFILSGGHAVGSEIVTHGTLNTAGTPTSVEIAGLTGCAVPDPDTGLCTIAQFFPQGFRFDVPQNIWTAEFQLPTPWVSIWGKYYRGGDTRFFFGDLNTTFSNLLGQTAIGSNIALSGDTVQFVNVGGVAQFVPLRPVRDQGGFIELGFPLSRIFGADPEGHNAGWNLYTYLGTDAALARDVRQEGANGLLRSDYFATSLRYKINKWAQLVNEVTWYDTRTADSVLKLYRGVDSHVAHDIRNEFGTIITF